MRVLSKRQREILTIMHDTEEELVYERGRGYIQDSPVAARTVFALLRICAISSASDSVPGGFERYTINDTGRKLLKDDVSDLLLLTRKRKT